MKRINLIIICSVAILATLSCCREDKPLSIEPMYAETYNWVSDTGWVYVDEPVSRRIDNCYYLRNFHNNKEDFKAILKFLTDSACILSEDSTKLILKKEFERDITFCLRNSGYFDDGVAFHSGKYICFCPSSVSSNKLLYLYIYTDSKYTLSSEKFDFCSDQLEIIGDTAIVTLNYRKFNTEVLQQFMDVVDQFKGYNMSEENGRIIYKKRLNPPEIYILKNKRSDNIEIVIKYINSLEFTFEII